MPLRYFLALRAYLVETRKAEREAYENAMNSASDTQVIDFDKEVLGRDF